MNTANTIRQHKIRALLLSIIALTLLGAASSSVAQYSGFYGEGFYGSGSTEFTFFTDLSDFDSDNDFFGITVGRIFNDNFAVEISYVDLGDSESVIADPAIATLDASIDAKALSVSAVGSYPLGRSFNIFGLLGFNQWDLDATVTDNSLSPAVSLTGDDRGTGINYGVGLQYRITPRYAVKLLYQVYELNTELFADDVEIGGVTIAFRFNY